MPDQRDNVIEIGTRFKEAPPVEVRERDYSACQHEHTLIDEKLRIVSCADCREERLDPIEVLIGLGRTWRRWQREAKDLRELNREHRDNERSMWERARDRHLSAHPDHRAAFDPTRNSWGPADDRCHQCYALEVRYRSQWYPTQAPEPPPGRLMPPELADAT